MKKFFILAIFFIFISCTSSENEQYLEESGYISTKNILVSSKLPGQIKKIYFSEGDYVEKGDTLLLIDEQIYKIKYKQVQASVEIAKAKYKLALKGARREDILQAEEALNQAKISLNYSLEDKKRFEKLYQNGNISLKSYELNLEKYKLNLSRYNSSLENLKKIKQYVLPEELVQAENFYKQAEANLEEINKSLKDCWLISPSNGYINKKYIEEGEMVSTFSSLLEIVYLKEVELIFYVSEKDMGKIKLGQEAEIKIDTYKDKKYRGKIVFISQEAEFTPKNIQTKDERTKLVFKAKIKVPNQNLELKPGVYADIKILLK